MSTTSTSSSAAVSSSVDEIEVDGLGRGVLEEPERLPLGALDRRLPGPEVALPDAQRPRQEEDVRGLPPRVGARALRRHLVPHRADAGTAHTGVAGERPQRDAPGRRAHLRQHPQARDARPGTATRCGPAARGPGLAARSPAAAGPVDGDAHAGARLVGDGVQREQRRARRCPSRALRRPSRAAWRAVADDRPGVATRSGGPPCRSRAQAVHAAPAATTASAQSGMAGGATRARRWGHDEPVGLGVLEDDVGEGEHVGRPLEQRRRRSARRSPPRHTDSSVSVALRHQSIRAPIAPARSCRVLPTSSSTAACSPVAAMPSANSAASSRRSVKRIHVARRWGSRKLFW